MLKQMLAGLWRALPKGLRLWGVRASQPKFTVTAGAVVLDEKGRVLLLKHVFRPGSGWGVPGGFISKGEQPEEAIRRELREETGLEVDDLELLSVRTVKVTDQITITYRCRALGEASVRSIEVRTAEWFAPDRLPPELSPDQRRLIEQAAGKRGSE